MDNTTLISIAISAVGASGKKAWGSATTLGGRCWLDVPTMSQKKELGAEIADAVAVAMIPKSELPASLAQGDGPARGSKLILQVDDGSEKSHEVVKSINRQLDGDLAHFEVYLKVL